MKTKKILITGSTGYIGRRLVKKLLENSSLSLRLFARNKKKVNRSIASKVEIMEGDTFNEQSLTEALDGVETAYYLVHSMGKGDKFVSLDRLSAMNFRDACIKCGVKRIIYLGGLGDKESSSKHLSSRIETGELLSAKSDKIQTIWFRAGVIIGSGSASFEIIRHLSQKLPLMITPKWVTTKTQCIGVDDVISYLSAAVDLEYDKNLIVDIGSEVVTFKEVMARAAECMGLKRKLIPVPFMTPKLSSYWLLMITPVPYSIASALVEGLRSETLKQNDNAEKYFPEIIPLDYDDSFMKALDEIEKNQVISRWCDSTGGNICDVPLIDDAEKAVYKDSRTAHEAGNIAPVLFRSVCLLGGEEGYFKYNFLWKLRGAMDKLLGGYGLSRGRRDCNALRIGDSLDFWKVIDIVPGKRLLLKAEMKVPGKAWLEFVINGDDLVITAYFYPDGLWGRLYWYAMKPFHHFIFNDLISNIVKRARSLNEIKIQQK